MYPSAIPDAVAKLTNKDLNNNVRLLSKYDCDFTKNPSCCERYLLRDIRHVCTHCISPYRGFIRRRRSSSGIPIC
ncbi:hypothetical protein CAJAP_00158 [Camponotus japonicus]